MIFTTFQLADSSGRQLYTRLHISPECSAFNFSGSIISADAVIVHETTAQAGVLLVPNFYNVKLYGRDATTQFNFYLSSSLDNTTASAANYIVNYNCDEGSCGCGCNTTASYALYAASSSYAATASYALTTAAQPGMPGYAVPCSGSKPTFITPTSEPAFAVDTSTGNLWWWYNGVWN